jgi:hypothetical protein
VWVALGFLQNQVVLPTAVFDLCREVPRVVYFLAQEAPVASA